MAKYTNRPLRIEALDDRRVLNAGPISSEFQLVSIDASTGDVSVAEDGASHTVEVNRHPDARNGVLQPLLTGDFNNDGLSDILSTDATDLRWWLQLNDGAQLFEFPVANGLLRSETLIAADFNQDDLPDVASINTISNEITISINHGTTFVHEVWGSFPVGMSLDELFVEDFSGDGRLDILAGAADGKWVLAKNQGGSSFDVQDWGQFPDFDWIELLAGNFNGDEFQDVVALAPDLTWWIWQGTPTGFGAAQSFGHWKMATGWTDIRVGDFSNDGIDDLIARTPDGKLRVATSEINRFNTWIWGSGWANSAGWSNVMVLDLNDDDLPDQISRAKDGTWWYAINDGGSFSNYFWQQAADADFLLTNFHEHPATDQIDSMPEGGVDVRDLVISATLNNQNQFEIEATGPLQIDGITFRSASGSLVPSVNGAALPGASPFEVSYGPIRQRIDGVTLQLDVGWDSAGQPDLVASLVIDGTTFPIRVPQAIGPTVTEPTLPTERANQIYFNTLPSSLIVPTFFVEDTFVDGTHNTIRAEDALLGVSLNDSNRIVLEPNVPLSLTRLELISPSGSMITLGDGSLNVAPDPFLDILVNSPSHIVLTSPDPALELTSELTLDIGWVPNATTQDLIVQFRQAGSTETEQAFVAEPLRLPFMDPAAPSTTFGVVRILPIEDPSNPSTTLGTTRISPIDTGGTGSGAVRDSSDFGGRFV